MQWEGDQEQITAAQEDESDYRRAYNVGAAERAREAFSEEDSKAKLEYRGGAPQRHSRQWGPWFKKWSEVVAMAAWEQGLLW